MSFSQFANRLDAMIFRELEMRMACFAAILRSGWRHMSMYRSHSSTDSVSRAAVAGTAAFWGADRGSSLR